MALGVTMGANWHEAIWKFVSSDRNRLTMKTRSKKRAVSGVLSLKQCTLQTASSGLRSEMTPRG